ncbi:MAG: trypsin-like peptidase domain-containing protein, partial [Verrucomicrobia bacterium]|nr:trypsin-like peptidase domain-containing protein [Verrucomicrobiota bacterium]
YGQSTARTNHSLGSGVIIDEDGYLVTNDHVVRRADKIQIQLATTKEVYEARLIATDPKNDIALLKITAPPGTKFTAIKFAPDDDLLLGETVLALGNPFGLGGSVSRGILSSKSRIRPTAGQDLEIPNCLQTDAAINPGNSGGPLVNLRGELIGVNVAVLEQSGGRIARGIGFAVPIQLVTEALGKAFTPESSRQLWFGAQVKPGEAPLTISSVQPGSPAALAGLKVGDVILQVNGKTPRSFIAFNELLAASPQAKVPFTIQRQGETQKLTVSLVPEKSFFNADLVQRKIGVTLQEITPQLAQGLGLPLNYGFIVLGTDAGSPAAAQLEHGAVITAIDGQTPGDLTEAARLLHAKNKGDTVRLGVLIKQQVRNGPFISIRYNTGVLELPVR